MKSRDKLVDRLQLEVVQQDGEIVLRSVGLSAEG